MLKKTILSFFLLCVLLIEQALARTCEIGVVPQFHHDRLFVVWEPILKAIEKNTACQVVWVREEDIPEFEKNLFEGKYDIAYVSPMHVILAHEKHGYLPIISSGTKSLEGIIVVPNNSSISNVSMLEGKTIAFPAPNAVVGSLVLRSQLSRDFGINFDPLYVGSHSNVYASVLRHKASAGGGVVGTFENQSSSMRKNLKVIYETKSYRPHAIIVHPRLGEKFIESIKAEVLKLSVKYPDIFTSIPMPNPVSVTINDYDDIRDLELEEFWVSTDEDEQQRGVHYE